MSGTLLLVGLVLLPLLGAACLGAAAWRGRVGRGAGGALATAALLATLGVAAACAAVEPSTTWRWGGALRLELAVTGFGRAMAVLVPLVAAPVTAYAAAEEERPGLGRLLALLCLFVGAMELLVVAGDLLLLLIGFEVVGACSWALIAHRWREEGTAAAADHAFLATRLGDLGLVAAAGAALAGAGSLSFGALAGLGPPWSHVVAGGVLLAALAKSAQVPFAPWLFAAMKGPTPVSALLHSATMVAAGAYALVRLEPVLGGVGWLGPAAIAAGLVTALAGGLVACLHDGVKNVLAASTSAHHGLVIVAVGAGSAAAGAVHLVAHALFKSLLFLGAGAAIRASGSESLRDMRPAGALPRAAVLFGVGILALAAVPPLGGAFSKEAVVKAAAHHAVWVGLAVLAAGFLSAFYAGRLQLLAFPPRGGGEPPPGRDLRRGRNPGEAGTPARRPSRPALAGMGALALLSALLGLLWLPGGGRLVERLVGGEVPPGETWELIASWTTVAAGLVLAWTLARRGRLAAPLVSERVRSGAASWLGLPVLTRRLVVRPVWGTARLAARLDDRVVDGGVRLAGRAGAGLSRLTALVAERGADRVVRLAGQAGAGLSRFTALVAERGADGVVRAVTAGALGLAAGSRSADEGAVDGAVEGSAGAVGGAGRRSRALQSGQAPRYYVYLAAGAAAGFLLLLLA